MYKPYKMILWGMLSAASLYYESRGADFSSLLLGGDTSGDNTDLSAALLGGDTTIIDSNAINAALAANATSIAQGLEQQVQGSTNLTQAQKQQQEQVVLGEFADNPVVEAYLQNYIKIFGTAQYAQAGQMFTTIINTIQTASFTQLVLPSFWQQTIGQCESALATMNTAFAQFGVNPDLTMDTIFTRSFFNTIRVYHVFIQTLARYAAQVAVSGKITVTDIDNLVRCVSTVFTSFDKLKGLYFSSQQEMVKDLGVESVSAESMLASEILAASAMSAKILAADPLNYYINATIALDWIKLLNFFTTLPNANFPHSSNANLYVVGYDTFTDYQNEVSANLAIVLSGAVNNGLAQMEQDPIKNKTILQNMQNYCDAAVQMYGLQNTPEAAAQAAVLQQTMKQISDGIGAAINQEATIQQSIAGARQQLQIAGATLAQIKAAYVTLAAATSSYANLITTYTGLKASANAAYGNLVKQQISGDSYVAVARMYWQSFLNDMQMGGGLLNASPLNVTSNNITSVIASLNSMCTNAVNVINGTNNPYALSAQDKTSVISAMYASAINSYNTAAIAVSGAGATSAALATDPLADIGFLNVMQASLQDAQSYFQNFGQAIQSIQNLSSDNVSNLQIAVQNALASAQRLQKSAQQTPQLALWLAPVGGNWSKALITTLTAIVQAQSFGAQNLLQYRYFSVLQSSASLMTVDQQTAVNNLLQALSAQVNISSQVQQSFQTAQASSGWSPAVAAAWDSALNLAQSYFLLGVGQLSLQDSATRLQNYITTLQAYVAYAQQYTSDFQTALTIYKAATKAYCASQACVNAKIALPSSITPATLGQLVAQAAKNNKKTGLFDMLAQSVQAFTTQTDPTLQMNAQLQLQNNVQQLNLYIQHQQDDWTPLNLQVGQTFSALLSGAAEQDTYIYTVTTQEGVTASYTIPTYNECMQPSTLLKAQVAFNNAQAATVKGDFLTGAQDYTQAAQLFYNASTTLTDATAIKNAQNQYFLSQTRLQASGSAAILQGCNFVTLGNFTNVPTVYLASSSQLSFNPTLVGALPLSLAVTQTTPIAGQQFSDFLNLLQVYIVYASLQGQGLVPSSYYKLGTLQRAAGLSASQIALITPFEQTAQDYASQVQQAFSTGFNNGTQQLKLTIATQLQPDGSLVAKCSNLPVPLLIPVTPNGVTASSYYSGAYLLFKPGTQLLHFGSTVYVPGQDAVAAGVILQNITKLYLACAYNYGQSATAVYNKLAPQLATATDIGVYSTQVNAVNNAYQNALAYIQSSNTSTNTAYGYATALAGSYPANVNQYVVTLYNQWASQLQTCLVGNPVSSGYQSALYTLNALYLQQSGVIPSLLVQSEQNIALAFKKAGDACRNFATPDPINGRVNLYPYQTGSGYYNAALQEYQKANDSSNQQVTSQLIFLTSALEIVQNANLYFDIKTNGTMYVDSKGTPKTVSWKTLQSDYYTFQNQNSLTTSKSMDYGELTEYNRVKNLLLDAAINITYLQNSVTTGSTGSTEGDKSAVLSALVSKGVIDGSIGIDQSNQTVRINLLQFAAQGYQLFVATPSQLSVFLADLSSALAYQYIYDYLGGLPASTDPNFATTFQNQWSQFFSALQNESISLENPSSAYLG